MIIFHQDLEGGEAHAGKIRDIFVHTRAGPNGDAVTEYFLLVDAFCQLTEAEVEMDPYLRYPLLNVRLYHKDIIPTPIFYQGFRRHQSRCDLSVQGLELHGHSVS